LYAVSKQLLQQQADADAKESRTRYPLRKDKDDDDETDKQDAEKTLPRRYDTARNNILMSVTTPSLLQLDQPSLLTSESRTDRHALQNVEQGERAKAEQHGEHIVLGLLGSPRTRCGFSANETVWIRKFELNPQTCFLPRRQPKHQRRPNTAQSAFPSDSGAKSSPRTSNAMEAFKRVVSARRPRTGRLTSVAHLAEYHDLYELSMETKYTPLRSERDHGALPTASCSELRTKSRLDKWRSVETLEDDDDGHVGHVVGGNISIPRGDIGAPSSQVQGESYG
jgi:hypothetical protein